MSLEELLFGCCLVRLFNDSGRHGLTRLSSRHLQSHFLVVWFLLLATHDDGKVGAESGRLDHATLIDLADHLARTSTAIEVSMYTVAWHCCACCVQK